MVGTPVFLGIGVWLATLSWWGPVEETDSRLYSVRSGLQFEGRKRGCVDVSGGWQRLLGLARVHGWDADELVDPWGERLRLELEDGHAWVRSLGPDRTASTADDLAMQSGYAAAARV